MANIDDQYQDEQNADEGEKAVEWLLAVGMDKAVAEFNSGKLIEGRSVKHQLSFLTPQQRGTVQKRLTVLNNQTLGKQKGTVKADTDSLPGAIQETNTSKYVFDSGKKRSLPTERIAVLRNYRTDSDGTGEPIVASGHQYISEFASTSQGLFDYSASSPTSNIQSASNLPFPHDPVNISSTHLQSTQRHHHTHAPPSSEWTHTAVTNGHKHNHNFEGDFEADDDFFELIDGDVDDDFVEEEEQEVQSVDEVDAPRLTLAPILTTPGDGGSRRGSAAPLTFAEPLSIDNSLYSLNQLDGTTTGTERTAAGSNLSSAGSTPSHQGNPSRKTSSSAVGGVADAIDRANARSYRLGSTGSLPKVIVSSKARKNGRSTLYDLSQADVTRLNSLSLLQLTSLFDQHDIPFSIPKKTPKVSSKHGPLIFGRSITSLVEEETKMNHNQGQYVMCPRFILELLRHLLRNSLEEDGILRKNGNLGRVRAYRHDIDQTFNQKAFDWNIVTNYDAASLLKQYLQELPIPVLTFEYMHLFPLVCKMNCKVGKKLEALNLLILMLPCAHSHTLKLLLIYLSQVVQNELHNQMNLESVAKIMTPTFFGSSSDRGMGKNGARSLGSIDDEMRSNQEQQEVMQLLINYHEQLWIVPDFLLSEIRFKDQHHGPADKQKSLPVLKSLFRRANANRRESSDLVDGHHHHHHHHHHHTHPSAVNHLPSVVLSPSASSFVPRKVEIKLGHNTSVEVDTQLHPTVGDIMNYVQHSTMGSHSKPPTSSPPTQVLHGSPVNSKGDSSQSLQGSPGSIGSNYKLSSSYSQEGWVKAIDGDVSKKLCLFEVGGNITKRCLSDEKALFSNLYELNPSASWVVEFR